MRMRHLMQLLWLLLLLLFAPSAHAQTGCTTTSCTGSPLPSGFLSSSGDQFVSGGNVNVRLACATFNGQPRAGGEVKQAQPPLGAAGVVARGLFGTTDAAAIGNTNVRDHRTSPR
jgi:hypothetical protein